MYSILVIDDERSFDPRRLNLERTDRLVHSRTSKEGLRWLDRGPWDELWLDHDLGGVDTTMPIVARLEERIHEGEPIPLRRVVVHSSNPSGARRIQAALEGHYQVVRLADPRPFFVRGQ